MSYKFYNTIKKQLKKEHPDWDNERIKTIAMDIANKDELSKMEDKIN